MYTYSIPINYTTELLNMTYYPDSCGIYLAPSSIPNAGFGLYAGRDFRKDEILSDSYSVLISDSKLHNDGTGLFVDQSIFTDYAWSCLSSVCETETLSDHESEYMISLFGSFANYHPYEINTYIPGMSQNEPYVGSRFEDFILNRTDSPGAGATTYYYDTFYAGRSIEAGEELFVDYGNGWSEERYEDFPLYENYAKATTIINDIVLELSQIFSEDIFDDKAKISYINHVIQDKVNTLMISDHISAKLLPTDINQLFDLYSNGISSQVLQHRHRSLEWLKENGQCMDNIRKGISSIEDAGYGAFATRSIHKGDLIAPIPLLQMNRTLFEMKILDFDDDGDIYATDDFSTYQLMLNYCFGHNRSDVLLCMLSTGGLINHKPPCIDDDRANKSQRKCRDVIFDEPNAEIRWSTWDDTDTWLKLSLDEVLKKPGRGISIDIFALRDIAANEEIFISYGRDWNQAWNDHIKRWNDSMSNITNYMPLSSVSFSSDNLLDKFNHPNLRTTCLWWDTPLPSDYKTERAVFKSLGTFMQRVYEIDGSMFTRDDPNSFNAYSWPCEIQGIDSNSRDGTTSYRVELKGHPSLDDPEWLERGYKVILANYPFESITLVNAPYESDQHLQGAFRRHIDLPDGMFPEHWIE